jgi:putative endonuclease
VDDPSIYVYIVECSDKTLYTGYTNNVAKRIQEHNTARTGAKYTRSRRPVRLVYAETCSTLPEALKREAEIKRFSRKEKLLLIESRPYPTGPGPHP